MIKEQEITEFFSLLVLFRMEKSLSPSIKKDLTVKVLFSKA